MPTQVADHEVRDSVPVFLTILIGEGQMGFSTVFLDQEKQAARREVRRLPLGDGAEARGKVLVVSTTVVDIRGEHDRTSVTVQLSDGIEQELRQSEDAHESGVVNYLTVIRFV
jgi:hypothetical protein